MKKERADDQVVSDLKGTLFLGGGGGQLLCYMVFIRRYNVRKRISLL